MLTLRITTGVGEIPKSASWQDKDLSPHLRRNIKIGTEAHACNCHAFMEKGKTETESLKVHGPDPLTGDWWPQKR